MGRRGWPAIQEMGKSSRSGFSPRPMTCAGLECWSIRTESVEYVARGCMRLGVCEA
jgi:hypothetical protein